MENAPDSFFLWNVEPTVIFGRNQDMEAEINIPYCREHGIECTAARAARSVYADLGNLMISYITDCPDVNAAFERYLSSLADALRGMGFDRPNREQRCAGRREKSVGQRLLRHKNRLYSHGTLLYDTDFAEMEHALTPSKEKLESKG